MTSAKRSAIFSPALRDSSCLRIDVYQWRMIVLMPESELLPPLDCIFLAHWMAPLHRFVTSRARIVALLRCSGKLPGGIVDEH